MRGQLILFGDSVSAEAVMEKLVRHALLTEIPAWTIYQGRLIQADPGVSTAEDLFWEFKNNRLPRASVEDLHQFSTRPAFSY